MNNFYCDHHLFLELERKQVLACGTISSNRKVFPRDIVLTAAMERRMDRGDYICRCYENLVTLAWYDGRSVYLIPTAHPPESIGEPTTVQCRSASGARQPIPCPPALSAYQGFMDGAALADQIQQRFSVIRRSNKTWKKLFYYGLKMCLLNSFSILKKVRQTPKDLLAFRIAIVRHLVEGKCFRGRPGPPPNRPAADRNARGLNRQYFVISVEKGRRDCVVCAKAISVQNLSTNFKYKTTVCVTCDRKPL
ncbi:PiggyBac transposable element-derived protein 4 [Acropora cervicornis]|uniref:PiggyBac transposable element-derived protein 4 n=1 Tax=Acropora cervicornis TaxID=6130 RepID=A0AAD9QJ74_ACRCE|nr:PiggyBac transposable element-derived protein 4 [Acropora cervicornis]